MKRAWAGLVVVALWGCPDRNRSAAVEAGPTGPAQLSESEPNGRPEQALKIAGDTDVTAALSVDPAAPDEDWYRLEPSAAGPRVDVRLGAISGGDVMLELHDEHRNRLVAVNSEGLGEPERLPNLYLSGPRLLRVTSAKKGTGGAYKLEVRYSPAEPGEEQEPNDRAVDANAIPLGIPVVGLVGHAGDEDWYRFELPPPADCRDCPPVDGALPARGDRAGSRRRPARQPGFRRRRRATAAGPGRPIPPGRHSPPRPPDGCRITAASRAARRRWTPTRARTWDDPDGLAFEDAPDPRPAIPGSDTDEGTPDRERGGWRALLGAGRSPGRGGVRAAGPGAGRHRPSRARLGGPAAGAHRRGGRPPGAARALGGRGRALRDQDPGRGRGPVPAQHRGAAHRSGDLRGGALGVERDRQGRQALLLRRGALHPHRQQGGRERDRRAGAQRRARAGHAAHPRQLPRGLPLPVHGRRLLRPPQPHAGGGRLPGDRRGGRGSRAHAGGALREPATRCCSPPATAR